MPSGPSPASTSRPNSTATSASARSARTLRAEGAAGFEARRRGQVAEDRLAAYDPLHLGDVLPDLPADVRGPGAKRGAPDEQLRFEGQTHPRSGIGRSAIVAHRASFRFRAAKAAVPPTNPTSRRICSGPAVEGLVLQSLPKLPRIQLLLGRWVNRD
jgi:hypothetical protein